MDQYRFWPLSRVYHDFISQVGNICMHWWLGLHIAIIPYLWIQISTEFWLFQIRFTLHWTWLYLPTYHTYLGWVPTRWLVAGDLWTLLETCFGHCWTAGGLLLILLLWLEKHVLRKNSRPLKSQEKVRSHTRYLSARAELESTSSIISLYTDPPEISYEGRE